MSEFRHVDWREAEEFAGRRLDRRRAYAIGPTMFDDRVELQERCTYTHSCSGCFEAGDYGGMEHYYPWDDKAKCRVGAGCEECGYTGKRREVDWVPVSTADLMRAVL